MPMWWKTVGWVVVERARLKSLAVWWKTVVSSGRILVTNREYSYIMGYVFSSRYQTHGYPSRGSRVRGLIGLIDCELRLGSS
jgi:hypothetical protein